MNRRSVKNALLVLLAGVLAACAPRFEPRPSPLAAEMPARWKEWTGDISRVDMTWTSFDDATLKRLMAEALAHNLDLESARRSLTRARLRYGVAEGERVPDLTLTADASRGGEIDGASQGRFAAALPARYEIDLWGRREGHIESAGISADIAVIDLQTAQISVVAAVADIYFQIRALDRKLALKQQSLDSILTQRDMVAARVRGGLATATDRDRQEVQVADLETAIEALRGARSQLEARLAVLLGETPQNFLLEAGRYGLDPAPTVRIGPPVEVLRHRPDIRAAELSLARAHIDADLVRTRLFPSLTVSASADLSSSRTQDFFDQVGMPWGIVGAVALPLLDGGARRAEIEMARLDLDEEITRYRQTILNALLDVESALAQEESLRRQQKSAARQRRIQERIQQETRAKFNSGRASSLDLIIEERNLIAIEEREVDLWQQSMQVSISLLRAFGVDPRS